MLLLAQAPARALFEWIPTDADIVFDHTDGYPEKELTGAAHDAPIALASGRWSVGLGIGESSDIPGTPNRGTVLCVREFEVTEATRRVAVTADFGQPCVIDIDLEPKPSSEVSTTSARLWTPPDGGELDDCRQRQLLLRVDPDETVWYQDVDSGERVEIGWPEFEGWTIERSGIDAALVSPEGTHSMPEWSIRDEQCLLTSNGQVWIGDTHAAWRPWEIALGEDVPLWTVVQSRVDVPEVSPPAAASLTPSRVTAPNRATLRAIDREIESVGLDRWSEVAPELYIGGRFDGPGGLPDALGSSASIDRGDDWWFITANDGLGARHVSLLRTPDGHLLWAPDETLAAWQDCSELIVPPIFPGPIEPGYETGLDAQGGLMTLFVDDEDGDDATKIVVDMSDDACRAHPVVGPMIEHLLAD